MRRYGFVSAGHGDKYRKAMNNLFEGARVWAAIPGSGYVGVGEVHGSGCGSRTTSRSRSTGRSFPSFKLLCRLR